MNVKAHAVMCVNEIISNLSDRRGLGQTWEAIDSHTQKEIVAVWTEIVIRWFEPDAGRGRL